jgi:hypothetical protein
MTKLTVKFWKRVEDFQEDFRNLKLKIEDEKFIYEDDRYLIVQYLLSNELSLDDEHHLRSCSYVEKFTDDEDISGLFSDAEIINLCEPFVVETHYLDDDEDIDHADILLTASCTSFDYNDFQKYAKNGLVQYYYDGNNNKCYESAMFYFYKDK